MHLGRATVRQTGRHELPARSTTRMRRSKVRHGSATVLRLAANRCGLQVSSSWCALWTTEALRVLKPGGHLLAFGGTRTWHRLAVAVEDAGFEIRDSIAWLYGSGFPKSLGRFEGHRQGGAAARSRRRATWFQSC